MIKKIGLSVVMAALLKTLTWGAAFPLPQDEVVNDFAQMISDDRKIVLKDILTRVESQTGVEMAIVTVPSFLDYKPRAKSIEEFSQSLFNQWGVGHKSLNNGVLILMSHKDRRVRFQFGSGFSNDDVPHLESIFDEKILPYFKVQDYSNALYAAAMFTVQDVTTPINFWEFYLWPVVWSLLLLAALGLSLYGYRKQRKNLKVAGLVLTGISLLLLVISLNRNLLVPGFGGGESSGVGLTKRWTVS